MADLGVGEKAVVRPRYPHMLAEDMRVWTRFLETEAGKLSRVWYDVHVGQSMPVPADAPDMVRRIAGGISRKRIDVVAEVGGAYWVIEVKPACDMVALGQVVTYLRLFELEFRPLKAVWGWIVCEEVDPDVGPILGEFGVSVFQVG